MPEPAVAHDRKGALAAARFERRGARRPQSVAHGGVAEIEGRQYREQVAADVAADVQRPELALQQLHRGENRPFRTAGAESGGTSRQQARERLHLLGGLARAPAHGLGRRPRRGARPLEHARVLTPQERLEAALAAPGRCIRPRAAADPLPMILVCRSALRRIMCRLCSMYSGWPSSTISIALLARAEADDLLIEQRIGDVEHIERQRVAAERIGQPASSSARSSVL